MENVVHVLGPELDLGCLQPPRQTGSISGHTDALLAHYIVGIFPH